MEPTALVKVVWVDPPERGATGDWHTVRRVVTLPLHIARGQAEEGRCELMLRDGEPVPA